jgi:hypothetical protein
VLPQLYCYDEDENKTRLEEAAVLFIAARVHHSGFCRLSTPIRAATCEQAGTGAIGTGGKEVKKAPIVGVAMQGIEDQGRHSDRVIKSGAAWESRNNFRSPKLVWQILEKNRFARAA